MDYPRSFDESNGLPKVTQCISVEKKELNSGLSAPRVPLESHLEVNLSSRWVIHVDRKCFCVGHPRVIALLQGI